MFCPSAHADWINLSGAPIGLHIGLAVLLIAAKTSMRPTSPWSRWGGPGKLQVWSCWRKNVSILMPVQIPKSNRQLVNSIQKSPP